MSRSIKPTAPSKVLSLDLTTAVASAQQHWQQHHLLDDLNDQRLNADIERLTFAGRGLGAATVADAIVHSAAMLRHLTGIQHLTQYAPEDVIGEVHALRNTLAAIVAAAAQHLHENPETLLQDLPGLAPRHGDPKRTLHDDEILLTRLRAILAPTLGSRGYLPACQYALAETGAWTSEVPQIRPCDLRSNPRNPGTVALPGVTKTAAPRVVDVPRWARPILGMGANRALARSSQGGNTSPFVYFGGHQPDSVEARSATSTAIARVMLHGGILSTSRPHPMGIARWRIAKILHAHGPAAAAQALGRAKVDHTLYEFTQTERLIVLQDEPETYAAM